MFDAASNRSVPSDRAAVARTAHDRVLAVVQGRTAAGVSVVIEGAAGIGKTFLVREILASVAPGDAKVLRVAGEQGRRNDPFAVAGQLLAGLPGGQLLAGPPGGQLLPGPAAGGDPGEAAFDHVDELCADGPVVLWVDDAHYLDAASLTLLRRLAWASQSLPLALLISTRPAASREQLTMLIRQAQLRLWLPPMSRMMVERLVFDRTGRWPGPQLRRILGQAAGNPLFVAELLRAYQSAGALAEAGPDTIEARLELGPQATGLDEMIRAQLRQLDEPTLDVLAAVAVWGTDIGVGDLAAMLFSPADGLDELIERAISSGLIRREAAGTIGFAHDLFREAVYAGLPAPRRRAVHRRAAQVLAAAGYSPSLVADHLLRASETSSTSSTSGVSGTSSIDAALVTALQEAVAATRLYAPEVTADLLSDVAAISGPDMSEPLLRHRVEALFLRGRGEAAETLIRERITTVTDPAIAAQLQLTLIRSLMNRGETAAALAAIGQTTGIAGLPGGTFRQLEAVRSWLLVLAGQAQPAAELDAMMARYAAAGDKDAQASVLASIASVAFLSGRPDTALGLMRTREDLIAGLDSFRSRSSALALPAMFELASSGPRAAQAAVDRARRLSADARAAWVDPFLGFVAGAVAFAAGDWDGAVAELDSALEVAEETSTGWVSIPVGIRSYIDAHRGRTGPARARLESFRHRGLPLQFGHDRPGWAELAVLEAEGAIRAAGTLARTLWSAARSNPGPWAADLAPDVTRIALAGMDRRLADQIGDDVSALCPPDVSRLVHGMIAADADAIDGAAAELAGAGRLTAEAFAREEAACAAAAHGDRDRAAAALETALAGYRRMGAVPDRDRALGRMRALGIRRSSREAHRDVDHGWAGLTASEVRIASLVRDGLTNREIGTRLFVSPRTVQTHVSHILQKTGLRSRVEIARFAEA
jgi:DNA-binding CsgD family transcriptional regulator